MMNDTLNPVGELIEGLPIAPPTDDIRAETEQVVVLERRISDLVNSAYGLSVEEIVLLRATALPHMPVP